jgi:hypothetical protein
MKIANWNQVIWIAINHLKEKNPINACHIDEVFYECEKNLYRQKASKRETELRLFALALYCDKAYNSSFIKSLAYSRFGAALDFPHFESISKTLIKENSLALIVFWVIFRLSFKHSLPKNRYAQLETRMKKKSFELGTNAAY